MATTQDNPAYYSRVRVINRLRHSGLAAKNLPSFAALGIVLIAACGTGGAGAPSVSSTPIRFAMVAQNGSTVTGTGEIVKGTGTFTITIKLTAMTPNSAHVSHIHTGRCAQPGAIVYALQQVTADSSGAATTTTSMLEPYSVPASGWYVNVHSGPDFTEADYAPSVSCGDLSAT